MIMRRIITKMRRTIEIMRRIIAIMRRIILKIRCTLTKMRTVGKASIEQFDGVFLFPQNEILKLQGFKKKICRTTS